MTTRHSMQRRLRLNRPSVREFALPPKLRTHLGQEFTAANLGKRLSMQHCLDCGTVQYPPRELCQRCLGDNLKWRDTDSAGTLLAQIDLHHGLWEFFKRHTKKAPWPIASVQLSCGQIVFAHVATQSFMGPNTAKQGGKIPTGTKVKVFSQTDISQKAVLVVVADDVAIDTPAQRHTIADSTGLLTAATKG